MPASSWRKPQKSAASETSVFTFTRFAADSTSDIRLARCDRSLDWRANVPEIKIDPQSNVLTLGTMEWEAHFDRIIVLQDDFRSGLECKRCLGRDVRKEISVISCENCNGTGKSVIVKDGKCSMCSGDGVIPCPECKGKGGTLILPENAERRPTTGTIVSAGERCNI